MSNGGEGLFHFFQEFSFTEHSFEWMWKNPNWIIFEKITASKKKKVVSKCLGKFCSKFMMQQNKFYKIQQQKNWQQKIWAPTSETEVSNMLHNLTTNALRFVDLLCGIEMVVRNNKNQQHCPPVTTATTTNNSNECTKTPANSSNRNLHFLLTVSGHQD